MLVGADGFARNELCLVLLVVQPVDRAPGEHATVCDPKYDPAVSTNPVS